MARQTFTEGQTVYCHRLGDNYKKAIVIVPDVMTPGFTGRNTHYVGVRYINKEGQPEGSEWPITNRSNLILTEEAFNGINRAKDITRLHGDIRAYTNFERDFLLYFTQAETICRTLMPVGAYGPHNVNELAHYLRGTFQLTKYQRMDRDDVRTLRLEKRQAAVDARDALAAMGEDAPELAKETGA